MHVDSREYGRSIKYLNYQPIAEWLLQRKGYRFQQMAWKAENMTWTIFKFHNNIAIVSLMRLNCYTITQSSINSSEASMKVQREVKGLIVNLPKEPCSVQ